MAKIYGGRSKYLVKNDWKFFLIGNGLIPVIFLISMFFIITNVLKFKGGSFFILLVLVLVIFFASKMTKEAMVVSMLANKKSNKYHYGWKWEDFVSDTLKTLSDDYIIFCDVNLFNKGNIDFVLLGPCGILAIEAKSHRGIISYNGNELLRNGYKLEKDFISQTKREALDLNKYLLEKINKNIFAIPVLVFSSKYAKMRFGFNKINNCFIIKKGFLLQLIRNLPNNLSKEDVDLIESELSKLYFN